MQKKWITSLTAIWISFLQTLRSCWLFTNNLFKAYLFPLAALTRNTTANPPETGHRHLIFLFWKLIRNWKNFPFLCWYLKPMHVPAHQFSVVIFTYLLGPISKFYLFPLTQPTLKEGPTQKILFQFSFKNYFFFRFYSKLRELSNVNSVIIK